MTAGHKISSPLFSFKSKESTFVDLSLFLYFLFISCDCFSFTKAIEREYFFPKISFFILRKGKLGSLPFVLFITESVSSTIST